MKNPGHHFIFIYDRAQAFDPRWPPNVEHIVVGPPARHPLLWRWWYDYRIPAVLKKIKADVFFSPDGFCSLRTSIPQCLVIHDLAFLHFPSGIPSPQLRYYRKYTPRFIRKAKQLITVSAFSKADIIDNYKTDAGKIHVIYNGAREIFSPIGHEQRTVIKNNIAGGREYFLYAGSIHPRKNLINLLKAFSLFKKRQQSAMKLVLAGRLAWKNGKFLEDLKSYKYRDDVVLTGHVPEEELASIMAGAYAFVYPSLWEGFGLPVIEAMKSGVAVISSENSAMQEIAGDGALYANPADPSSIAEKMMLLYKDERLRSELVEKGKAIASGYSWDLAAEKVWQVISLNLHP